MLFYGHFHIVNHNWKWEKGNRSQKSNKSNSFSIAIAYEGIQQLKKRWPPISRERCETRSRSLDFNSVSPEMATWVPTVSIPLTKESRNSIRRSLRVATTWFMQRKQVRLSTMAAQSNPPIHIQYSNFIILFIYYGGINP